MNSSTLETPEGVSCFSSPISDILETESGESI